MRFFLILIVFLLFFTETHGASAALQFMKVNYIKSEGVRVISAAEFDNILAPYLGKEIDLHDQATADKIIKAINVHYIKKGFWFARVTDIKFQNNTIYVRILEGHINKIHMAAKLKNVQYLQFYLDRITAIKPFNIYQANADILKIHRLLGSKVRFAPVLLEPKDPLDPKLADLFLIDYMKYTGEIDVDNYHQAHTHSVNQQTALDVLPIMFKNDFFAFAEASLRIRNPFDLAGVLDSVVSSSGDKKYNFVSMSYAHQLNTSGTKLISGVGYERVDFFRVIDLLTLSASLSHPLLLQDNKLFEVSTGIDIANIRRRDGCITNVMSCTAADQKGSLDMSGQKINIGALYDYNKDGFKFIQSINLYAGQAKKNLINIPSTEKYKYTKLTSSSALRLHLYKNFKLDFTLNTQYSKAILPMIERFSAGRGLEGQGFQNSQIGGDCGVAGAIVLSRTYLINHVLLRGVSGYSYVNSSIAYERSDTAYTKGTAVGAGVRLFLANDLRVKLELNKPLYQKLSSKTANADKSFRVFLGLTYNFSF